MRALEMLINRLHQQSEQWMKRYARAGAIRGFQVTVNGQIYIFDSCNDLGVPYFHMSRHGSHKQQLFTVPQAEKVLRGMLKK